MKLTTDLPMITHQPKRVCVCGGGGGGGAVLVSDSPREVIPGTFIKMDIPGDTEHLETH